MIRNRPFGRIGIAVSATYLKVNKVDNVTHAEIPVLGGGYQNYVGAAGRKQEAKNRFNP